MLGMFGKLTGASQQTNTATMPDPRRVHFYDTDEAAELERNANSPVLGNEGMAAGGGQTATPPKPSIAPAIPNGILPTQAFNQPLITALQNIAKEQDEDAQIIVDLTGKGNENSNRYGDFRKWAT